MSSKKAFSITAGPSSSVDKAITIALVVLGLVALVAGPAFVPDNKEGRVADAAKPLYTSFRISNFLHTGKFRATPRRGDERPSDDAMFYAVTSLSNFDKMDMLPAQEDTKEHMKSLDANSFGKELSRIFRGLSVMSAVGMVGAEVKGRYYELITSLASADGGFRLNDQRAPSVSGTYYGLQSLKLLGRFDEFKSSHPDVFAKAIDFVKAAKDEDHGFRDGRGGSTGLLNTWHAVQVLKDGGVEADFFRGVAEFVASCQYEDGGFADSVVESVAAFRNWKKSNVPSTAQALYLYEDLKALDKALVSDFPVYKASGYLRACVGATGVRLSFQAPRADLLATYYFSVLSREFNAHFGAPRSLQLSVVVFGIISFVLALFFWFRGQFSRQVLSAYFYPQGIILVFLTVGAASVHCHEGLAVVTYISMLFYTIGKSWALAEMDPVGDTLLSAIVHGAAYGGLIYMLYKHAAISFIEGTAFYLLTACNAPIAFLLAYIGSQLTGRRAFVFVNAAFIAFTVCFTALFVVLQIKDDLFVVSRNSTITGQFPFVFVLLPFLSVVLNYTFAGLACYMFNGSK